MQKYYSDKSNVRRIKTTKIIGTLIGFATAAYYAYQTMQYYLSGYMSEFRLTLFFVIMFSGAGIGFLFFYEQYIDKANRKALEKQIEKNKGLIDNEIRMTLLEDVLEIIQTNSGVTSKSTIQLTKIQTIETENNYIHFNISGTTMHFYIPYDAFETKENREDFICIIKKYSERAK